MAVRKGGGSFRKEEWGWGSNLEETMLQILKSSPIYVTIKTNDFTELDFFLSGFYQKDCLVQKEN